MALAEASVPRVARRSLTLRWVFPSVCLALDVALVNLAFAIAYWLRYRYHLGGPVPPTFNVTYQRWAQFEILISALMPASFVLAGIYRQRLGLEWLGEVFAVARAATVGMALAIIVLFTLQHLIDQHSRLVLIYTWLLIIVLGVTTYQGYAGQAALEDAKKKAEADKAATRARERALAQG